MAQCIAASVRALDKKYNRYNKLKVSNSLHIK